MKYANKLTNEQIKDIIFNIYNEDNISSVEIFNTHILIHIDNKYEDTFDLSDYKIEACDFYDVDEWENNIKYRKKMLEYFGEQYAIDYLLNE